MTSDVYQNLKQLKTRFIFVVGGVMSGVGKGISAAAIGQTLQNQGYSVSAMKIDPYINIDAGSMNPIEHGEIFVTSDGDQTDQDIGNYERFLNTDIYQENYMTTGRVYHSVLEKERSLAYQGKCVQVVPHIPFEVLERIEKAAKKTQADILMIEIGGTVGEYENLLFLEAARMLKLYLPEQVLFIMVSYLPVPQQLGEMKTKPTQHAVRNLQAAGIQADFLIARSERTIDQMRTEKISVNCNLPVANVIPAPNASSIYDIAVNFDNLHLSEKILAKFKLEPKATQTPNPWLEIQALSKIEDPSITVAIVGKYIKSGDFRVSDAYVSIQSALKHAGIVNKCKVNLTYVSSSDLEKKGVDLLSQVQAIIVAPGQGGGDNKGKILASQYAREHKIPFLGIGLGLHIASLEIAQNLAQLKDADSVEFNPDTQSPLVVPLLKEYSNNVNHLNSCTNPNIRLGASAIKLVSGTKLAEIYDTNTEISERQRQTHQLNPDYISQLEEQGLVVSAISADDQIVEAIELKDHPYYFAVQYHPEYSSRPLRPHPIFVNLVKAGLRQNEKTD